MLSYRRPYVKTLEYLPFCKVYVDGAEHRDYVASNPKGSRIVRCLDGVQGNVARVRNYILDTEFKAKADAVLILDDDMDGVFYFEARKEIHRLEPEEFIPFIERGSLLAREWGAYFWGLNVNPDPQCYRECAPFSTLCFIGGPFGVFLRGGECRYDERLPLKEDYDMTLQHLCRYRLILRFNKYFYRVKQSEQVGGCASYRNLERERQQLELLQAKWGKDIVRFDPRSDRSHRAVKKRTVVFDYNPIIRVPIRGI